VEDSVLPLLRPHPPELLRRTPRSAEGEGTSSWQARTAAGCKRGARPRWVGLGVLREDGEPTARHGAGQDEVRRSETAPGHARGSAKCDPRPAVTDWTNVVRTMFHRKIAIGIHRIWGANYANGIRYEHDCFQDTEMASIHSHTHTFILHGRKRMNNTAGS
jgi:hypothetical protein